LVLLLASGQAFARNCEEGAADKSQMLDCLYQESQRIVDDAYRPLHAELKKSDPFAAAALQKSQESWKKFADDSCNFYILIAEGEIPTDAQVNCWNDFANARARVLKAWLRKIHEQRN